MEMSWEDGGAVKETEIYRVCVLSIETKRELAVSPAHISRHETKVPDETNIRERRREIRNTSINYCTRRLNGKIIII